MSQYHKSLVRKVIALSFFFNVSFGQDYSFAIDQIKELPPYLGSFMDEYMRDINENLNNQFFFASQTSSVVLPKGGWEISVIGGGAYLTSGEINSPTSDQLASGARVGFNSRFIPTVFGSSDPASLTFTFENPDSGKPLTNPFTGETVEISLDIPSGLGLGFGATPSAALQLGYGLGFGTEIKAYFTPMLLSIVGETEDGLGFSSDMAYGMQFKHELSHWIPGMKDKGYHLAIGGGYSVYQMELKTSFLSDPLVVNLSDSIVLNANDNLEGASYELSTYGGRVLLGKTWKYFELALSADYTVNNYSMVSEGTLDIELIDQTGNTANLSESLSQLLDFDGSNTQFGYGASLTIGQGLFRTALSYRRANTNFAAISFQFHFGGKKKEGKVPAENTNL